MSAKKAADMLMGFYPRSSASDPEIFMAGLISLLDGFPEWVLVKAVDARKGLVGRYQFLPSLKEIGDFCQAEVDERRRMQDLQDRWKPALPNPHKMPPVKNSATRSALCERYGLKAIPPGWDAVDVVRAAARYGDQLPQVIEQMLLDNPNMDAPKSVFARVLDQAKAAMERRLGERPEAAE